MSMSVKGNSQGALNHSTTFLQPQVPYGISGLKAARNEYQNGMEGMDIGEPQPNQQPNQQLELKMNKDLKGLTSTQTPPHILNHHLPTLGAYSVTRQFRCPSSSVSSPCYACGVVEVSTWLYLMFKFFRYGRYFHGNIQKNQRKIWKWGVKSPHIGETLKFRLKSIYIVHISKTSVKYRRNFYISSNEYLTVP
ncbi:hypothetical protein ACFX2B_026911 [Malus domestica]